LTLNRANLENAMIGSTPLQQQVMDVTAVLKGDPSILLTLAGALTQFEPTFDIMPGTTPGDAAVPADGFDYRDLSDSSGG
jgi:alkyl sulfatase BDS1-like metallo-beta-lactamase superfamily hydrolase